MTNDQTKNLSISNYTMTNENQNSNNVLSKAEYNRLWRYKNKDKVEASRKRYIQKKKEAGINLDKIQYERHKEKYNNRSRQRYQNNKSYFTEYNYEYCRNNREKYRQYAQNYRRERFPERLQTDPMFAIKHKLRAAVRNSFRRIKQNKPTNTETLLGCTWQEARQHIESLWTEGMSWKNYGKGFGKWEIDHIRPVSSFGPDDIHLMNKIENLQPLWMEDNLSKRGKHEIES